MKMIACTIIVTPPSSWCNVVIQYDFVLPTSCRHSLTNPNARSSHESQNQSKEGSSVNGQQGKMKATVEETKMRLKKSVSLSRMIVTFEIAC
jgi:hypothetical protein